MIQQTSNLIYIATSRHMEKQKTHFKIVKFFHRSYCPLMWKKILSMYWSGSSSRHCLRFLSNIFKKQSRNLCVTPLLFCMNHNDLPTKLIFIKESARWSGIHYYDVAIFNRKWPQQKQFSPIFRNIVFCEDNASKGKKNDILEN